MSHLVEKILRENLKHERKVCIYGCGGLARKIHNFLEKIGGV
jgi:hypothetical protein